MITTFTAASINQGKTITTLTATITDKKKMLAAFLTANIYAILYTSTLLRRLPDGGGRKG